MAEDASAIDKLKAMLNKIGEQLSIENYPRRGHERWLVARRGVQDCCGDSVRHILHSATGWHR